MGEATSLIKSSWVFAIESSPGQSSAENLAPTTADSLGGRIQIRWDESCEATPHGQIVFFAEFLATTGIFDAWVASCPLEYTSHNAPAKRDVLGTLLLSILAGNRRYAHITGLRGDGIVAKALGMKKLLSADAVRRALSRMDADTSESWLQPHLSRSVTPALDTSWILDLDATIKPLYGHQEGADISYNPHKPGRPSHALHTYWVSGLRMVLDVLLKPGNDHAASHGAARLTEILHALTPEKRPAWVRGDCGYGNQPLMEVCEQISPPQPYLYRLRQTSNVKKLLTRLMTNTDWTQATRFSKGFEAIASKLRLDGWTHERRVIVLRRSVADESAKHIDTHTPKQLSLPYTSVDMVDGKRWEFTILVTNSEQELGAMGQLYRDRCDCENGFDELKNQWGWGGFTTQDLGRNQTVARIIALVYNWWSWYARAANPQARLEASTSRPLLLAAIGRVIHHAGQTVLCLTPMHADTNTIKAMIGNIAAALQHVRNTAQQLKIADPWHRFVRYVCDKILAHARPSAPLCPILTTA